MVCSKCGKELEENVKFCQACGEPVAKPVQQTVQQPTPVYQQQIPQQPIYQQQAYIMPKKKKGKGCLITLIVLLIIIAAILGFVAIFLPGFFGPNNLGVKTSKSAYESALAKLQYIKDTAPKNATEDTYNYIYGPTNRISTNLTSEELTSFFNYNRPDGYAVKKVQIKINKDNSIEIAAELNTKYFIEKVIAGKYSEADIKKSVPMLSLIPKTVNIYTKLTGEIVNNQSNNIAFSNISVMGIGLPENLYNTDEAKKEIANILNGLLEKTLEKTGAKYDLVKAQNGELILQGKIPSSLTREAKS